MSFSSYWDNETPECPKWSPEWGSMSKGRYYICACEAGNVEQKIFGKMHFLWRLAPPYSIERRLNNQVFSESILQRSLGIINHCLMIDMARSLTLILLSSNESSEVLNLSERRDADRSRTRKTFCPEPDSKPEPKLELSKIIRAPKQISYNFRKRTNLVAVFYYTLID